jgi:hypothetical protein
VYSLPGYDAAFSIDFEECVASNFRVEKYAKLKKGEAVPVLN